MTTLKILSEEETLMNEEKVTTQSEIDNSIGFMPPASKAAMNLRLMMDKVEGEDKCTLCKAAEELEKLTLDQSNKWSSMWLPMIMMLIFGGFGGDQTLDPEVLTAYIDVIKEKAQSQDSKLQNES